MIVASEILADFAGSCALFLLFRSVECARTEIVLEWNSHH